MEVQDSPVHLVTRVLGGDGRQLPLRDSPGRAFNHALRVLVAQFGAGADDGPAKPFSEDLQRWTDCEGEFFFFFPSAFSFTQPFICTHSTETEETRRDEHQLFFFSYQAPPSMGFSSP